EIAPSPDAPPQEDTQDDDEEEERTLHEDVSEIITGRAYHDWGRRSGFAPYADFRSGTGLVIGAGPRFTRYGFRRDPYRLYAEANALYAIESGGFGVEGLVDYHLENSNVGMSLTASATQFETFRFFGYGNDTDASTGASARVERDQLTLRPSLYWSNQRLYIGAGPIFRYGDPRFDDASPIAVLAPEGVGPFAQLGAAADLKYRRGVRYGSNANGFAFDAGATAYPALLDADGPFGRTHAVARAWIPIGTPFVALRLGGEHAWGDFPVHEAAFLGGRNSLRGFETDRFAGDAALFGSSELHLPLGTVELLVRGDLGVFGLADAGRVWFDGESDGGW